MPPVKVFLSLGTNLGDKQWNIREAVRLIGERVGRVVEESSVIETAPWGFDSDNTFLNACIEVETPLSPRCVLKVTQQIERQLGRTQKSLNGIYHDRLIDIDILLYGDITVDEPDLRIPHPLMYERDFVMTPLKEIMKTNLA